jgi:glycosidase
MDNIPLATFGIEHKAALPYCYYDKIKHKIVLRVISLYTVNNIKLLWGDPYKGDKADGQYVWHFEETVLYQQFSGPYQTVWKAEIDVPPRKRLKYGFRIKTAVDDFYFSEYGLEPYSVQAVNQPHNHFVYPFVHSIDSPPIPGWAEHTVWYQIFPERFCNGNPALSPPVIEDWESGKPAHGNFFGGDLAGIRQKLSYLEQLGINGIYLTPVFQSPSNHKYDTQDYFAVDKHFGSLLELKTLVAEAHSRGIKVMLDAVFNHIGNQHPFWQDILKYQEKSKFGDYFYIHSFPVKETHDVNYDTFAFSPRMPKWNTESPNVRSYLLDAAAYWIRECDIDGWRLDVANEVSLDFWKDFSRLVRSLKKDFYITGEVWHDASNWINSGLFDAVMNYPLNFAVSDYFLKKKMNAVQFTNKLISALTRYSDLHNRIAFNLLDSHDTDRALTKAGGNKLALRNAFTMLFLLPGSPCLYYGTEVGMEGGGDPDNRRPMVWNEAKQDKDLLHFFQKLIAFRKNYFPLISNCLMEYKEMGQAHCWKFSNGKEALAVLYTEQSPLQNFYIPGVLLFSTADFDSGTLPPYSMAVYHSLEGVI